MTTAAWVVLLAAATAVTAAVVVQRLATRRAEPSTHAHWRGAQAHSLMVVVVLGALALVAVTAWGHSG